MKKLISMILVAALCLSLACCKSDDAENPTHETEDGVGSVFPVTEPDNAPKKSTWSERIPGEYRDPINDNRFVLNADGTCTIEGGNYTWKITDSDDSHATVDVFDGNMAVYQISLSACVSEGVESLSAGVPCSLSEENSFLRCGFGKVDESGSARPGKGQFYNTEDFYVIELTPENWLDYFEFVEECNFYYDDAEEVERIYFTSRYQLKEEYRNVFSYISRDIFIYYNTRLIDRMFTVDTDNKTYQWGEIVETRDDLYTETGRIAYFSLDSGSAFFGFMVSEFGVTHFPTDKVTYREYLVTGFSGTIYSFRGN